MTSFVVTFYRSRDFKADGISTIFISFHYITLLRYEDFVLCCKSQSSSFSFSFPFSSSSSSFSFSFSSFSFASSSSSFSMSSPSFYSSSSFYSSLLFLFLFLLLLLLLFLLQRNFLKGHVYVLHNTQHPVVSNILCQHS